MKFKAHFYLMNYDFSPEFADAHYNGEPSENNRLYDWEDELVLTNEVRDVKIKRDTSYFLEGTLNDGQSFKEEVKHMTLFEIEGVDGSTTWMGCSECALAGYDLHRGEESITLRVYLSEREPLSNPVTGIYIAAVDFPKSLID